MRSIIIGPSGSGKTILLQNMILDIYDGCFDKLYIFSPSVHLDHTWQPVKEYIKEKLKIKDYD
jgi:ABC-type proline/glycine betaine transport system ATPase subunit